MPKIYKLNIRIRTPRVGEGRSRRFDGERTVSERLLGNFDYINSPSLKIIEQIFGQKFNRIPKKSLIYLANIFSDIANVNFPRNYKRQKPLIIKWLEQHFDEFKDISSKIKIEYEDN